MEDLEQWFKYEVITLLALLAVIGALMSRGGDSEGVGALTSSL